MHQSARSLHGPAGQLKRQSLKAHLADEDGTAHERALVELDNRALGLLACLKLDDSGVSSALHILYSPAALGGALRRDEDLGEDDFAAGWIC